MTQIPDEVIAKLLEKKLVVGDPFISTHVSWPDGRFVYKPASAGGNRIPYYKVNTHDESVVIDAPVLNLCFSDQTWRVEHWWCAPGPGPGDFIHKYDTAQKAIDDILDYFFGDISRMLPVIYRHVRRHKKRFEWEWRQWERRQQQSG